MVLMSRRKRKQNKKRLLTESKWSVTVVERGDEAWAEKEMIGWKQIRPTSKADGGEGRAEEQTEMVREAEAPPTAIQTLD